VDGVPAKSVARWDGVSWSPVGDGFYWGDTPSVFALEVFDAATVRKLYAGGHFIASGGTRSTTSRAGRDRNGCRSANGINGIVRSLTVFNTGSGWASTRAATSRWRAALGTARRGVGRTLWHPLGDGIGGAFPPSARVGGHP
jgi:hypothetical protein